MPWSGSWFTNPFNWKFSLKGIFICYIVHISETHLFLKVLKNKGALGAYKYLAPWEKYTLEPRQVKPVSGVVKLVISSVPCYLTFRSSVSSSERRGTIILSASAPLNRVCHVREDKRNTRGAKMLLLGLMVKSGLQRRKGGHCTGEKQWPQKLFFFCLPRAMFKNICQALHTLGDWWRSGSLFLYKHCLCLHKTASFTEKILSAKVSGLWLWELWSPRKRQEQGEGSAVHKGEAAWSTSSRLQGLSEGPTKSDFQIVSFALGEASGRKMNANPDAKWGLQYKNMTHLSSGLRLGTEKTIEGMLGP